MAGMQTVWRGMDLATLDREYNARASVPDFDAEYRRYVELSAAARQLLEMWADLVFDPESGNALDWFPGAPGGPVLLWIHGGYWRALSKADQSLVAAGLVPAGAHVAVMDYSLAPAATLGRIVHQVRLALAWVRAHASGFGADPARLYAGGSSAGGHLTGMLLADGWHGEYGMPTDALRGGVALSGLFDLAPIQLSHVNAWMKMDRDEARLLSPQHLIPNGKPAPRLLASYGGRETAEFKRQTEAYAAAWADAGHQARVVPQERRNHFDLVAGLGDAADPLCRAVMRFMMTGTI
jgi:arylformamidase